MLLVVYVQQEGSWSAARVATLLAQKVELEVLGSDSEAVAADVKAEEEHQDGPAAAGHHLQVLALYLCKASIGGQQTARGGSRRQGGGATAFCKLIRGAARY